MAAADTSVVRRAATKKGSKKAVPTSSNLVSPSRSVSRKEKVNAVSKASLAMLNPAYAMGLELDLGCSVDEAENAPRWTSAVSSRHGAQPSVTELEVYTMEELAMGKHIVRDEDEEAEEEDELDDELDATALPYVSPVSRTVVLPPVSPSAAVPMSAPPTMSVFEASPPDSSPRHGTFRRELDDAVARGRKPAKAAQSGSSLSRFFTWKRTGSANSSPKTVTKNLGGSVSPPGSAPAFVTTFSDAAGWRAGELPPLSAMRSPRRVPVPALPPILEGKQPQVPDMARQRKSSLPTLREIRAQMPSPQFPAAALVSPTYRGTFEEQRGRPSLDAARRERSPARSPRAAEAASPRSPLRPLEANETACAGGLGVARPRMRISTVGRGSRRTAIFDSDHDVFSSSPASPTPLKPVIKLSPVPASATAKQRAAARANKPTSTFVVDDEYALAYDGMAEQGLMADRKFRRRSRNLGSSVGSEGMPDFGGMGGASSQPWAPELACFPSLVQAAAATASPRAAPIEVTVTEPPAQPQTQAQHHQATDSVDVSYTAEIATVSARRNVNTVMGRGVVGKASPSLVTRSPRLGSGAMGVVPKVYAGMQHVQRAVPAPTAAGAHPLSPPVIVNIMPPTPVLGTDPADDEVSEPLSPRQTSPPRKPEPQQKEKQQRATQPTVPTTPVTVVKAAVARRMEPSMQQLSTAKIVSWQRVSGIGSMDEEAQREMKRFEDVLEAHLSAGAPLVEFRTRRNGSDATDTSDLTGSSSQSGSSDRPFAYESTNGSPGRKDKLASPTRSASSAATTSTTSPFAPSYRRRPNHQPSPSKSQFSSSSASTNNLRALSSFGSSNSLASDFTASTSILDFGGELAADGFVSGLVGKGDNGPESRHSGPPGPPPSFDVPELPKSQLKGLHEPFELMEPLAARSLLPYDEPEDCETPKLSSLPLSTTTNNTHLASPAASSPFGRSPASSSVMTPPFAYDLGLPEELADLSNDPTISGAALAGKSLVSPRSAGTSPRRRSPAKSRGDSGSVAGVAPLPNVEKSITVSSSPSSSSSTAGPHLNLAPGIVAPVTPP